MLFLILNLKDEYFSYLWRNVAYCFISVEDYGSKLLPIADLNFWENRKVQEDKLYYAIHICVSLLYISELS